MGIIETKEALDSRIEMIKPLIIEADKVYKNYLTLGDNATIYDYQRVNKAISNFYKDKVENDYTTPNDLYGLRRLSMYKELKSRSLMSSWAIKKMDRELLKKEGIKTEALLNFKEPVMDEVIKQIDEFIAKCLQELRDADWAIDCTFGIGDDIIKDFVSEIKRIPKSKLNDVKIPDVQEFMQEIKVKVEERVRSRVDKYKSQLMTCEEAFREYKEKGDNVTYVEFESIYNKVAKCDNYNSDNTKDIKKIATEELVKEGCLIAKSIDKFGGLKRTTEAEIMSKRYIDDYRRVVESLSDDNIVREQLEVIIKEMKNLPISSFPLKNMDEPYEFIAKVMAEKLKKSDENAPPEKQ